MKYAYMLLYKKNPNAHFGQDYYFSEKAARDDANRLFTEGFYQIELYIRRRGGWSLVERVIQNAQVALTKQQAHIERLANACGAWVDGEAE